MWRLTCRARAFLGRFACCSWSILHEPHKEDLDQSDEEATLLRA
jgi:hypothetical protein